MKKGLLLALSLTAVVCGADELDTARQALRDGLWSVARLHAGKVSSDAAKLVILESYAEEGKWDQVRAALAAGGTNVTNNVAFAYYRAVVDGRIDDAIAALRAGGSAAGNVEALLLEADLRLKKGERAAAERLWGEVLKQTNATVRAQATAALALGDVAALRAVRKVTQDAALRLTVELRLGQELLRSDATREEGAKIILTLAKEHPDAVGVREAFVSLLGVRLAGGAWTEVETLARMAVETWPETAQWHLVALARGEALLHAQKAEESLKELARAETLATNDEDRVIAAFWQGEALTQLGRTADALAHDQRILERYPKTLVAQKLKRTIEIRSWEAKGRDFYRIYRFEDARAQFRKVAEADPARRPRMAYCDILCLYGLGHDAEAVAKAEMLAKDGSDASVRADARLWLAKFAYNRGEWKRAGEFFALFAEEAPQHVYAPMALLWASRAASAANDFPRTIRLVTTLSERHPTSEALFPGLLVQSEALIALARFDEAILVLDRVSSAESAPAADRHRARLLKADALFALGADNPVRYEAALEAYRAVTFEEDDHTGGRLSVAFKIGRVLEKLKRRDEATDQYYTRVVLAYREGRLRGETYGDEGRTAFSRAAFRLADDFESRGRTRQAIHVLRLVVESDVPSSNEAARRIERLTEKGVMQ